MDQQKPGLANGLKRGIKHYPCIAFGLIPAIALALCSCAVGPNYKTPSTPMPAQFNEIESATKPTTEPSVQASPRPDYQAWWETLRDPELNSLIRRAIVNNPNVVAAEARIREARANKGIYVAGLFPDVGANASYDHSRFSQNTAAVAAFSGEGGTGGGIPGIESDLWQAGLDMNWEIDVFGQNRRQIESATYGIEAAWWDKRDVLVSLVSDVAVNYVELRGAQRQLLIAQDNLKSQQQTLELTRRKAEGGLVPYLDVAQQEAQVDSTASTIPSFQAQIRLNMHHLGILLGEFPGALQAELRAPAPIPVGPSSVPPGVPGDLLLRRPDIRRAERQLAEATANIGVATADLYPKFSITGALGDESESLKSLFDWTSREYDIIPGVSWDIFNAGKVTSNIHVQNARQAEALQTYRSTVLQSLSDVDDALVSFNREQARLESLRGAVAANQKAVDLSTELFDKGSTDFLNVLDAQRSLFAAEDSMVQSEQQVTVDLIALYKALGGGWQ